MESRRNTGVERCRLSAITRRSLVGATIAVPAIACERGGTTGQVLVHSRTWLAIDAELERLTLAWQDEESRLAKDFGWLALTGPEQHAHPQAREIYVLDAQIKALIEQRWALLEALEALPAYGIHDVAAKLAVAVSVMRHEDAIGFDLLAEAVRELSGQRCRACGAALIPPDLSAQG
jgi:hypothetical protein